MTYATGIARLKAPIDRNDYRSLKGTLVALMASVVLAACGGGAETTDNPITQVPNPGDAPYTGPVARDADVLKFQQEFWSNAKTSDRCGSCHNEGVGRRTVLESAPLGDRDFALRFALGPRHPCPSPRGVERKPRVRGPARGSRL